MIEKDINFVKKFKHFKIQIQTQTFALTRGNQIAMYRLSM